MLPLDLVIVFNTDKEHPKCSYPIYYIGKMRDQLKKLGIEFRLHVITDDPALVNEHYKDSVQTHHSSVPMQWAKFDVFKEEIRKYFHENIFVLDIDMVLMNPDIIISAIKTVVADKDDTFFSAKKWWNPKGDYTINGGFYGFKKNIRKSEEMYQAFLESQDSINLEPEFPKGEEALLEDLITKVGWNRKYFSNLVMTKITNNLKQHMALSQAYKEFSHYPLNYKSFGWLHAVNEDNKKVLIEDFFYDEDIVEAWK